ncbi:MAG: hypothetical protein Q7S08_01935 [bacterium]|nr:hypothetical protein [bacterium]
MNFLNWIKTHFVGTAAILGIFLISLAVTYYFLVSLPNQKRQQFDTAVKDKVFAKNIDCQKYTSQVKSETEGFLGMKVVSGVFYSQTLNSCLYAGLDWDDKIVVRDALSKQEIFSEDLKDMKAKNVGEEVKLLVQEYSGQN